MNDEMKLKKFENFIKQFSKSFFKYYFLSDKKYHKIVNPLNFIYDMNSVNEYSKIAIKLIEKENNNFDQIEDPYTLEDIKVFKKDMIEYNYNNTDYKYKFIFWALIILSFDKSDLNNKLSMICDFARCINIKDSEIIDLVNIIKIIFGEQSINSIKNENIKTIFKDIINMYE